MSYCYQLILKPNIFNVKNKTNRQVLPKQHYYQRCAPAFSIQSRRRGSFICPPLNFLIPKKQSIRSEKFRLIYERGDLPCIIHHATKSNSLKWFIDNLETLNIDYYLPIFIDGLCETKYPYSFIAFQGTLDLVEHASHKIHMETISKMILPIKRALYTNDSIILSRILTVLQKLASGNDGALGVALVPYFNQILPIINIIKERYQEKIFQSKRQCNIIDDYGRNIPSEVVRLVDKTLTVLEQFGGQDAFINIKFSIPTYEQQVDLKQLSSSQTDSLLQPLIDV